MTFEIGLSCSGGVSAGAYIAGALDFLFQALDEWEEAKHSSDPAVPRHQVTIKVLAGASAGAISASVAALALARHDRHRPFAKPTSGMQSVEAWMPLLYQTWVVWPRLVAPPQVDPDIAAMANPPVPAALQSLDFLTNTDVSGGGPLPASLLNVRLLNYIAARALQPIDGEPRKRSYISENLDLFLTTTNNRGIPYALPFKGGTYSMVNHADRAHYRFFGLGTAKTQSEFGERDPSQPLNAHNLQGAAPGPLPVETLLIDPDKPWADWYRFGETILASAAFPIGLAPRFITADRQAYDHRLFPQMNLRHSPIHPSFPGPNEDADYLASDGGIIDNDPIEYVIAALPASGSLASSPQDIAITSQAAIMIAPFPEPPSYPASNAQKPDVISLAKAFFGSLREQVRFKPDLLLAAADANIGNRFMIVPSRRASSSAPESPYPLASGVLGGFGGFIHRAYREHDFQLGRRNCQRFLQTVLMLPSHNPLFGGAQGGQDQPVIPLLGKAAAEVPAPSWPKITQDEFATLMQRIAARAEVLRVNLLTHFVPNWFTRQLAAAVAKKLLSDRLAKLSSSIQSDLKQRDQI